MSDTHSAAELPVRARRIRLAIFDVDGVLTDGKLYFLVDGSEFKTFNTLDGHGIKMLIASGVRTAIITGRDTPVVERRARNLGIQHLYQGREDKLAVLDELLGELGLGYEQVAYLGDDLPDLPVIRRVGLGMAVASADPFVRQHAHGVTAARGGEGAAREFCELIMRAQGTLEAAQGALSVEPTMPKTLRQKLLLALIALLLIVAGYYWNVGLELFNEQPTRPGQDNTIDYYAENAHSLQYQEDGSLDYEMTAVKLEHQKATDITFVTTPDLLLFRGNVQPWHIQSARAEVGPKGKEVELIDDVRVARTDAKGQPSILTTTRLTVFPDKNYAQTEQAVKIDAANGVTTAVGMKAYLKDSRMHLLSNVRGQHEVR